MQSLMRNTIIILLITVSLFQCFAYQGQICKINKKRDVNNAEGFLFIDISKIYHHGGKVTIYNESWDTILFIVDKNVRVNGVYYDLIEEDYLCKRMVNAESFDPEYGLFVLKCFGEKADGFYKVSINGKVGLILNDTNYIDFKDFNRYILETYPIPTVENPLRTSPNDNAQIINDFEKWTFLPLKIVGDWVQVIDDKNCYKGEAPSPIKIIGWIRWKKNGEFILKVAYNC